MQRSLWFATAPLWLILTACGSPGHASSPSPANNAAVSSSNQTAPGGANGSSSNTPGSSSANTAANPTDSSNASTSSGQSSWTDQVVITSHTYTALSQKVVYPEVQGLPNASVQAQINALLRKNSIYVPTKNYTKPNSYTWNSSYNVVFEQGDIVNFLLSSYFYATGAAHGMPGRTSLIVNLKTGQVYSMKDIFQPGSAYLKAVSQVVASEDTNHTLDTFQKFTGVTNKDSIYLEPNGFVVDFAPYEWASFAQGFLDYPVSFASVNSLVDKNGSFWKALNDPNGFPAQNTVSGEKSKISSLGYTAESFPEWSTLVNVGNGQVLSAWVATRNGKSNNAEEKVFFFLDGKYLGTDTSKAHGYVDTVAPNGQGTISVTYENSNANGTGNPFTINYHWNGSKLVLNGSFPSNYTWY